MARAHRFCVFDNEQYIFLHSGSRVIVSLSVSDLWSPYLVYHLGIFKGLSNPKKHKNNTEIFISVPLIPIGIRVLVPINPKRNRPWARQRSINPPLLCLSAGKVFSWLASEKAVVCPQRGRVLRYRLIQIPHSVLESCEELLFALYHPYYFSSAFTFFSKKIIHLAGDHRGYLRELSRKVKPRPHGELEACWWLYFSAALASRLWRWFL